MSAPTDPSSDELRTLRARAYGPDADIHDDPAALARLHELEERARITARPAASPATSAPAGAITGDAPTELVPRSDAAPVDGHGRTDAAGPASSTAFLVAEQTRGRNSPSVDDRVDAHGADGVIEPDGVADGIPSPADAGTAEPADGQEGAAGADGGAASAGAARAWWRRRIPVLWAGSLVVALVAGIGLTLGVQALESGQVAVLQVDEKAEWPEEFFGTPPGGSRRFDDFLGLTLVSFEQENDSGGPQTCLYVFKSLDGSGFAGGSCGAGGFAATASMSVGSLSPKELRERFADGTSLQFVLDGAEVRVYARGPGIPSPTP